jgi:hypothetical protein
MFIIENFPDVKLVRYVDDFIILCKDESKAKEMYEKAKEKLDKMGLKIYTLGQKKEGSDIEKTKITCAKGYGAKSFNFLGLSFNHKDVDITEKKKKDINSKILEIIHSGNKNFLEKSKQIELRLKSYIDHYKKPHYSRTVASLNKIVRFSETELKKYYIETFKKITHKEPFDNMSESTIENLFKFMGIDFKHITNRLNQNDKLNTKL